MEDSTSHIFDQKKYDEQLREKEIRRLSETFGREEPVKGILTDDEILKYAGHSRTASEIRLKRGIGSFNDKLTAHREIGTYWMLFIIFGWVVAVYAFLMNVLFAKILFILILLILSGYTAYYYFLKDYTAQNITHTESVKTQPSNNKTNLNENDNTLESLNVYKAQIEDLTNLYDIKERIVIELIEKKFPAPQITNNKFMEVINSCTRLFNNQIEILTTIIKIATTHTPKIDYEIESRINILRSIIEKVDLMTNELIVNIDDNSNEINNQVNLLLDDMEELIQSIKKYN